VPGGQEHGSLNLHAVYAFDLGPERLGLLNTAAIGFGLPVPFLTGYLMDRFGRRSVIVPGFTVYALAVILMSLTAFFPTPVTFFLVTYVLVLATQGTNGYPNAPKPTGWFASQMTTMVPRALPSRSVPAVATANATKGATQVSARLPPTAATARIDGHSCVTSVDASVVAVVCGRAPAVGASGEQPYTIMDLPPFMSLT
jgi:MFS family permease